MKTFMVLKVGTSFEKTNYSRKESFYMTTDKNTANQTVPFPEAEQEDNAFKEKHQFDLSGTQLEQWEISMKQPIKMTDDERKDPHIILDFLQTIESKFHLELSEPTKTDFFKVNAPNEKTFEDKLREFFGDDELKKTYVELYIHLYLLNRKTLNLFLNGGHSGESENFSLRDYNHLRHINYGMFHSFTKIPEKIIERSKYSRTRDTDAVKAHIRKLKKLEGAISAIQNKIASIGEDESVSRKERQNNIIKLDKERRSIIDKIVNLNEDVKKDLFLSQRIETATPDEIAGFVVKFLKIVVSMQEKNIDTDYKIENDGSEIANPILKGMSVEDIYIQDISSLCWVKLEDNIRSIVSKIAPTLRMTSDGYKSLLDAIKKRLMKDPQTQVIQFKERCIFTLNGVIELNYKDKNNHNVDLSYRFINNKDMTLDEIMYDYPTPKRINVNYDDSVDYTFSDYGHDVTPDFIFGHLGRIGYEITEDISDTHAQQYKEEQQARTNLLMQFFIKTLLPYNDLEPIKERVLYFFNARNSGKTTFIELMQNIIGHDNAIGLSQKDISSQSEFGGNNVRGKQLLTLDEFTDGRTKIDSEKLKQMASKSWKNENVKNGEYIGFRYTAEIILASNEQPKFADESGGMDRRLIAFELATGYDTHTHENSDKQDLQFIKNDYILKDAFKSACIKWALNHVNIHQPLPQSIELANQQILVAENDVIQFITERLQPELDKPLFLSSTQLYELFRMHSITENPSNTSRIRNKTNFLKVVKRMTRQVRELKSVNNSKLNSINNYIDIQSRLYYDFYKNGNAHHLNNEYTNDFISTMKDRRREIEKVYGHINEVKLGNLKASLIGRSNKTMYCILPNEDMYRHSNNKELKTILSDECKHINVKMLEYISNTSDAVIKDPQNKSVPLFMRANVSNSLTSYTNQKDEESMYDRVHFNQFIDY